MTKPNPLFAVREDDMFRFHESYEESPDGCYTWTGRLSTNGYGRIVIDRRQQSAHRVAYFLTHGSIDQSLVIDHLCRNRACVNPDHLELVTQKINVQRGDLCKRSDTHCKNGHEYTPENTIERADRRLCRECHRDYHRENQRRIRATQEPRSRRKQPGQTSRRTQSPRGVIPHGTISGYMHHKCRCDQCKAIKAEDSRLYRASKRLAAAL